MRQSTRRPVRNSDPAPVLHDDELRRQRRVEAFCAAARPAIERLACTATSLEDLADSFPALLFALATDYGSAEQREMSIRAVLDGHPLREAANRLGLPFWLRKLPAASLQAPLINPPSDPALVARLVSLIPQTPGCAAAWLDRVLIAHHAGGAALTLWVAQEYRAAQPSSRSASFLGALAWAWFSTQGRGLRGESLMGVRWKPTIGARRAGAEAKLWRERLALDVCLGPGIADTWLQEASSGDLSFVALRTAEDFIAEAQAMDNCLDRYADRLVGRSARVFSVRREGRSIANLEIAPHEAEPGHPVIAQLRGPHNRRAPLDVWQAAYAWLGSQPLRLAEPRLRVKPASSVRRRRQLAIWQPFIDALPPQCRDASVEALLGRSSRSRQRAPLSS